MTQFYKVYQFQQYDRLHGRCLPFVLKVLPDVKPDQGPRAFRGNVDYILSNATYSYFQRIILFF